MESNAFYIQPTVEFKSAEEVLLVGTLFAELGDMVAGFASENNEDLSEERLTAIAYVSQTLSITGNQFIERVGANHGND